MFNLQSTPGRCVRQSFDGFEEGGLYSRKSPETCSLTADFRLNAKPLEMLGC
jgi:hypothetical protein